MLLLDDNKESAPFLEEEEDVRAEFESAFANRRLVATECLQAGTTA